MPKFCEAWATTLLVFAGRKKSEQTDGVDAKRELSVNEGRERTSEVGRSAGFKAAVFPTETAYERELRKHAPAHPHDSKEGERGIITE